MNAYFDRNNEFNSNSRIFEAYYQEIAKPAGKLQRWIDAALSKLSALTKPENLTTAIRLAKVAGVALSLVGLVGIIGAMESGALGLGNGLLIGSLLVGVEYLCLRGRRHAKE